MANLTATSSFDNVYQLETTDQAIAGAGGIMNRQAQALLNRTQYLLDLANTKLNLTDLKTNLNATGTAPLYACRTWVNFSGIPLNGTYSQSGTTVTVTMTAHGLSVGQNVNLTVTSGTGVSGSYTVATVVDANTFTYTAGTSLTTSGNITRNLYIRASGNVSSITDNAVGIYTVNFITQMPDANYSIVMGMGFGGGIDYIKLNSLPTISSFQVITFASGGQVDAPVINAAVFR